MSDIQSVENEMDLITEEPIINNEITERAIIDYSFVEKNEMEINQSIIILKYQLNNAKNVFSKHHFSLTMLQKNCRTDFQIKSRTC